MEQAGILVIDCVNPEVRSNLVKGYSTSIRFTECLNPNAFRNIMQNGRTGIGLIDCSGRANIKKNFSHQIDEMIRVEQTKNLTSIAPIQKKIDRDIIIDKNKPVVDKNSLVMEHSKNKFKEILKYERKFNREIKELLNLEAQEKILKNYAEVKKIQHKKANWGSPILVLK